jgi:ATP-dependent Clp protease protease subunit
VVKIKRYFSLLVEEREASVYIFGDIVSWEFFENDVSSCTLAKQIEGLDVDRINVYINSYGGEVAEGLAIYNQLRRHKAKVVTYCDGFACSAASVVFMAGEERIMSDASLLWIHNAWTYAAGDANIMRKEADSLDTITAATMKAYLAHVNLTEDELKAMMDAETWISAEDAAAMGFATSVEAAKASAKPSQSLRRQMAQTLTQPPVVAEVKVGPTPALTAELDRMAGIVQRLEACLARPEPEPQENKLKTMFAALFAAEEEAH